MISFRRTIALSVFLVPVSVLAGESNPPETLTMMVVDEYHGVKVVDDYRWLENWENPKVEAWSEAE